MGKRKREPAESPHIHAGKAHKKKKAAGPRQEPASEQEFKIRRIINESKTKYHIDWADDEVTGEKFQPTWEPKANANELAVADWEATKAARAKEAESAAKKDSPRPSSAKRPASRRLGKTVVESSPSASSQITRKGTSSSAQALHRASEEVEFEREIGEGPQPDDDGPLFEPPESRNSPAVVVSEPPASYRAGAYQRVEASTQVSTPASFLLVNSPSPAVLQSTAREYFAQDLLTEIGSSSSRVLPDSETQDSLGSAFQRFSPEKSSQPIADARIVQSLATPFVSSTTEYRESTPEYQQQLQTTQREPGEVQPGESPVTGSASVTQVPQDPSASGGPEDHEVVKEPWQGSQESFRQERGQELARAETEPGLVEAVVPPESPIQRGQPDTQGASAEEEAASPLSTKAKTPSQQFSAPANLAGARDQVDAQTSQQSHSKDADDHSTQAATGSTVDPVTQPDETADNCILISSENSVSAIHSFDNSLDHDTPPAGQRPLLSSTEANSSLPQHVPNPFASNANSATQSSFSFQTQVALSAVSKRDIQGSERTSLRKTSGRALFNLDLPPLPRRAPSIQSALSQESSPFRFVRSDSLGNTGESTPTKFGISHGSLNTTSPVRTSMEATPPLPLADRLRAMHERNKSSARTTPAAEQPASALPPSIGAKIAAARLGSPFHGAQDRTRSPSAVPAMEPAPEITKEEMNTSERYDTLLPQARSSSSGFQGRTQNGTLTDTASEPLRQPREDPEVTNVHVVPVPLMAHQRDQYQQNIFGHKQTIDQFLAEGEPSEELLVEAEAVIQRLRNISLHPDLVNHETQSQVPTPELQAQWDANSSAKFHFLKELLLKLQQLGLGMHVAVTIQGDRAPDMLETFFKGINMPYKRYFYAEAGPTQSDRSKLRVSIVDLHKNVQDIDNVDLVIAMDGTSHVQHQLIRAFRHHARTAEMSSINEWAMLLTLVAPNTIEHIERCMAPNIPRKVRARVILRAALRIESRAGRAEHGQSSRKDAAEIIAKYLDDPETSGEMEWPLAGLSTIEDLDSQTETEIGLSSNGNPSLLQDDATAVKRPFGTIGVSSPTDTTKRPRLTPGADVPDMPATMNPQDLEITHISDSVGKATQPIFSMINTPSRPSETEVQLSEMLKNAQERLDDHVKALEDLQYRHEDQRKELVEVKKSRDKAVESVQNYLQSMTLAETNNTALRRERSELKQQLEDASRRLLSHSVPEQVEFETLRLQAQQVRHDKEKAEKRADAAQKDLDWTREVYQDCSSKARELAKDNTELTDRLSVAQNQASGERAQEASNGMRLRVLEKENKKLRLILTDRDAGLKFRDEEIARLRETRGRLGTRNSSVPRSPRMGSPMKSTRSRQASPAVGEPMRRTGSHLNPSRGGAAVTGV